jgi:primosomal protein N' (replication factor Y)
MFAEVILSKATRDIDKIYHYKIPQNLEVQIGSQVLIPFGRRMDIGYVVGLIEESSIKGIKEIIKVTSESPLFTEEQVKLARWMSHYYYSFFVTALRCVMAPGRRTSNFKPPAFVKTSAGRQTSKQVPNNKSKILNIKPAPKPTEEQQKAFDLIVSAVDQRRSEKFLLYGITGSGKTEVYLQAIAHILEQGKSAIVLVPEIGLTPQLVQRFRERFQDHIAVLHSHMTLKQRTSEWERIASGEARIALGTRSAIFAPVKNLGLIVIDEEYEITYKQEKSPRYHVREVAFYLSKIHQAAVIMGSATPSIETYYHADTGAYKKLVLTRRIDNRPLPPVEVVDMREEKDHVLSEKLRDELRETLSREEQAILFINRRGYFTFIMCRECGFTIECPKCSVSLTYHSGDRKLRCNRCGYSSEAPIICPRCQSSSIKYFGTGTQRIEKEVAEVFPAARILRYDRDTVSQRGSHEVFFSAFAEGKANVLIGTQMVTKGLDVPNVTLVGVVSADTALHLPDFRSAEHTFQLLTQVAGRAGRHHLPGKVFIQTHTPEHYAIQAAAKHDYESFYRQEIENRKELNYPPFSKLISLLVAGQEESKVIKISEDIEKFLKRRIPDEVLGPAPAIIPKLRGHFRYRILLKGQNLGKMRRAVAETLSKVVVPFEIKVAVDVEPMGMM